MSWLDGMVHRIRTVLNPRAFERDLADEMQLHVDLDTEQQRDRNRARRRFGNVTYHGETTRSATWLGALDVVQQDARFAWRSLKRNPGITTLIVVTFTLGIGVNAATFTLLDKLYLRPPAGVASPNDVRRLWFWWSRMEGGPQYVSAMSFPMYPVVRDAWDDPNGLVLVHRTTGYTVGGTRGGAKVDALFATANYFPVLGLRPQLGRFYSTDEDRLGSGAPVVVLSDHLWRAQFGADSGVIGKLLKLDTERYTIIGVAPAGFTGADLEPDDVWIPMASSPQPEWMKEPFWQSNGMYMYQAFVRARPTTDVAAFERRATRAVREFNRVRSHGGDTLMTVATGSIIYPRGPGKQRQENVLSTRLGAVAIIVLIIAVANVVNLLLARATRRRREIAVRIALGVGRWRLVRMLTAETLLLAIIAAAAAVMAAWWGGTVLRALVLPDVRFLESPLDLRLVVATLALALVAGLVAGIVPALQASNPDLTRALKEGTRDGAVHRSRLRSALVVTQAALSVVLLTGAALFVQSLRNVRAVDIGYDAPSVIVASPHFDPGQGPPTAAQAAQMADVVRRFEGRPGVLGVARSSNAPMYGYSVTTLWIDDDSASDYKHQPVINPVTSGFFAATGIRLLRGRVFEDAAGALEVVINKTMAEQQWPGVDPMGRCIRFDRAKGACYSVVGIVETARRSAIIEEPQPQYYLSLSNLPASMKTFGIATALEVRAAPGWRSRIAAELKREIERAFPGGYAEVHMLSERIERQYHPWRVGAVLFTGFGVLALVVALVGIYSTVSYGVSQRSHEFGVRIALGALFMDILRLVLGEGLRTVTIGVVVGIALALAAGRLVASLLYGIAPGDPIVMLLVSVALLAVAAFATLLPAWRAGRVDPMTVLRAE